uniref:NADH dehydrogenase subunit 4 n=1 Tax=Allanaspides hickmani TaxID=91998 RepID=UPI002A80D1C1|nr:NADH dehydrogenase subunit 4 [Allanaspides hickmani]WOR80974.1 NADH dehydrogenase subunit 4 [Allanaspides hickmani]WOR80987.1 NADH dehydrogenase subunit 4 [Allanaspides hickmani]
MLKFIMSILLLMLLVKEWWVVQHSLFFMVFMLSFLCMREFKFVEETSMSNLDSMSYILILLSFWIISLFLTASMKIYSLKNFNQYFMLVSLFLLLFLILSFSVSNFIFFYISFEASLIPTLMLILGWGYQPERIQAGLYMLFYTLFASLPLLVSLLSIYFSQGTLEMKMVNELSLLEFNSWLWYLASVSAFIVKMPMFMVHLWLPKAHVEAPVAGSMILAGVLLKLGGYGLIRIMVLFNFVSKSVSWVWVGVSLVGGVVVSLVCLRQVDIKALIAYSSVAHMSLVLSGLMVLGSWGINGALMVMVGHGLCSSGLFCIANMVYERLGSRSMLVNKGLLSFMPSMALWWFLLSAGNMAAPPSLNLLGEVSLIISMASWSKVSLVMIGFLSFFSAAYSLYMFSLSQHGHFYKSTYACCSGKVREYLVLMLHWLPLNMVIMNSMIIMY